ncbi:MAG: hypothetical protein AB7H77_06990 [Bdellovibrionales bacterium]
MKRQTGWELKFSAFLKECAKKPFQWGQHDCAVFPAGAVYAITGFDPACTLRGAYDDRAGADRIIAKHGSVEALFTSCVGFEPHDNWKRAKRGDVVLFMQDGAITGGVVDDSGQAIAAPGIGETGLLRIMLSEAIKIWSY